MNKNNLYSSKIQYSTKNVDFLLFLSLTGIIRFMLGSNVNKEKFHEEHLAVGFPGSLSILCGYAIQAKTINLKIILQYFLQTSVFCPV